MRYETVALPVVQNGTGTGAPVNVSHLDGYSVQLTGIAGGGAIKIEASLDGVTYYALGDGKDGAVVFPAGSTFTADGLYRLVVAKADPEETPLVWMRTNRTIQGTGNPTALLGARNLRD